MCRSGETRTCGEAAEHAAAGDRAVNDGDVAAQLILEHLEVLGASVREKAVGVCELREDADVAAVLELRANSHHRIVEWRDEGEERLGWGEERRRGV